MKSSPRIISTLSLAVLSLTTNLSWACCEPIDLPTGGDLIAMASAAPAPQAFGRAATPAPKRPADGRESLRGERRDWARAQALEPTNPDNIRGAGCGLIAAEALERFLKHKPTANYLDAILGAALAHGLWSSSTGMFGDQAEQRLLALRGIRVTVEDIGRITGGDGKRIERRILELLETGKPVIISGAHHYYFVSGFSGDGRLFVGHTGEIVDFHMGKTKAQARDLYPQDLAAGARDDLSDLSILYQK